MASQPLKGILSRCPFVQSSLCNAFQDRAHQPEIVWCSVFKWVAVTYFYIENRIVVQLKATRLAFLTHCSRTSDVRRHIDDCGDSGIHKSNRMGWITNNVQNGNQISYTITKIEFGIRFVSMIWGIHVIDLRTKHCVLTKFSTFDQGIYCRKYLNFIWIHIHRKMCFYILKTFAIWSNLVGIESGTHQ